MKSAQDLLVYREIGWEKIACYMADRNECIVDIESVYNSYWEGCRLADVHARELAEYEWKRQRKIAMAQCDGREARQTEIDKLMDISDSNYSRVFDSLKVIGVAILLFAVVYLFFK